MKAFEKNGTRFTRWEQRALLMKMTLNWSIVWAGLKRRNGWIIIKNSTVI